MIRRHLLPDFASLVATGVALMVVTLPLQSPDLFFHLAAGKWILAHGLPETDPFSTTATSAWFPHSWLFDVVAEWTVRVFGGMGPRLLTSALVALSLALFWRTLGASGKRGLLAVLLFVGGIFAQSQSWEQERPYHAGTALFCATILLVQRWRAGSHRLIWLIAPLTALWANLHGSWILAPAFLGCTAVLALLENQDPAARRHALQGLAAAVTAFLASALSPKGPLIYGYPFGLVAKSTTQLIDEWAPLDPSSGPGRAVLVFTVLVAVAAARTHFRPFAAWVPAAGLAYAAFGAQRHAPLSAIALAAACVELVRAGEAWSWPPALRVAIDNLERRFSTWNGAARAAWLPFALVAAFAVQASRAPKPVLSLMDGAVFPVMVLDTLATMPPGRVLTRWTWGGAVSYLAGPEFKVFIDGRNDPFPTAIHRDYKRLVMVERGWRDAIKRYDPKYILWGAQGQGSALMEVLKSGDDWVVVDETRTGSLLVRRPPAKVSTTP